MKDFFISYNQADLPWAEWIAWTLEKAGYSIVMDKWDFRPGNNWVIGMLNAISTTKKTIIVLSESYLDAQYTHPEWAAAFAGDPRGEKRKILRRSKATRHRSFDGGRFWAGGGYPGGVIFHSPGLAERQITTNRGCFTIYSNER